MNGLNLLRWVLLLIGAAILVGIYLAGRRGWKGRRRTGRPDPADPRDVTAAPGDEAVPVAGEDAEGVSGIDEELADFGRSIRLEDAPGAPPTASAEDRRPAPRRRPAAAAQPPEPDKIVALYVTARDGGRFRGADIRAAAAAAGLEYGEMKIFHRRHRDGEGERTVFSMANMVEPGWFDLEAMDELKTPGLALFMQRPGPLTGSEALDDMVRAARVLQAQLQGELRDASRSVLSQQTIEHLRDDIREFERRRQAAVCS